jgi:hypothetical protein
MFGGEVSKVKCDECNGKGFINLKINRNRWGKRP